MYGPGTSGISEQQLSLQGTGRCVSLNYCWFIFRGSDAPSAIFKDSGWRRVKRLGFQFMEQSRICRIRISMIRIWQLTSESLTLARIEKVWLRANMSLITLHILMMIFDSGLHFNTKQIGFILLKTTIKIKHISISHSTTAFLRRQRQEARQWCWMYDMVEFQTPNRIREFWIDPQRSQLCIRICSCIRGYIHSSSDVIVTWRLITWMRVFVSAWIRKNWNVWWTMERWTPTTCDEMQSGFWIQLNTYMQHHVDWNFTWILNEQWKWRCTTKSWTCWGVLLTCWAYGHNDCWQW